jgi:hypothetical protein
MEAIMSYYSEIKAAAGEGPPYARREAFTTIYGYAAGNTLGSFPSVAAAKKAGATVTDTAIDKDAFDAAKKARADFDNKITADWLARVRADYPSVNDALFDAAYSLAYERGHSYGYDEVEGHIDEYLTFALKVIEISKAS